jgi:alkylation response protein AidB-like acyl-CoA dehydrogenase
MFARIPERLNSRSKSGWTTSMNFLKRERETLERLLPGLDAALEALPLMEMERPGNPAFAVFKRFGGPGLLVPLRLGGRGATALDTLRAHRAIAYRAPSLAVATTMHHFTIASLTAITSKQPGAEDELLAQVAAENLYIGSGFAEGRTGASIQASTLRVERGASGYLVNGSKKPCSLSGSMDLFAFSSPPPEGMDAGLAAAIIPADTPGLERRPYWESPILGGAESDEVILRDVELPEHAFFPLGGSGRSNAAQDHGFVWFELLITVVYVGIAGNLVERVLNARKGDAAERVRLVAQLEGAMAALEGVARAIDANENDNDLLARVLLIRYGAQDAVNRAASLAVELLGGTAFIRSFEVSYFRRPRGS